MVNVVIIGAAGRMGQSLIRCIRRCPEIQLAGAVEFDQCPLLGRDAGIVAGVQDIGILISADLRALAAKADVLIDFSFASATAKNAVLAAELRKGMVIGTTGLSAKETAAVEAASARIPIVWSPNMSMGVNLLISLVSKAARMLADYDVEVVEMHHRNKKDSPSGTALRLAEAAADARGLTLANVATHGREGMVGARPAAQIGLHAIRGGDVVGDHTVIFASEGERVELTHKASSRDCLAMGALRAAAWVHGRKPGRYSMQDVLDIRE